MIPILSCYTAMQGMMKKSARICSTSSGLTILHEAEEGPVNWLNSVVTTALMK